MKKSTSNSLSLNSQVSVTSGQLRCNSHSNTAAQTPSNTHSMTAQQAISGSLSARHRATAAKGFADGACQGRLQGSKER